MRIITLIIFVPVIILAAALRANAQECKGSLGDPVINQDFGSGGNPGPPLSSGITNMTYTTNNCPNDGEYTIANSLTGSGNCHPNTWHNVTSDHTGNPNGYMMIVNADTVPSIFFTQSAPVLCPNTTYQFSAYILNLITLAASTIGKVSEPDITFSVETTDGKILSTHETGTILPTTNPVWNHESLFFTTPPGIASVVVKMTNNAPGGNGNDLILDDITFSACGPLVTPGFNSVGSTTTPPLCEGDSQTYILKASVQAGIYTNPVYQWQQNLNGAGWTDIPGATSESLNLKTQFQPAVAGTYQYRMAAADGPNISSLNCRVYSDPLTVTVNANPVVTGVSPAQSICEGDTLTLSASGGVTYQWSGPNLPPTSQNPVIINHIGMGGAGKYKVIAYSQYSCSSIATTQVTVNPKVVAAVAAKNVFTCQGVGVQIEASGGASYLWSPGSTLSDSTSASPIANPLDTTTYTVKVSNAFGCYDTQTVTVNVLKTPIANAGSDKIIFEGQSVKLNATQKYGNIFSWTPIAGLSDPSILRPVATPVNDITYTLHVSSTDNCGTDSSSVFVRVYKKITIPNTFSPNNDGINDFWDIKALITYPQCLLQVYDRYGQQVYRSIGYNQPWDGKYNGQFLPPGTYYYVLDLENKTPKISGWVLIAR